MDTADKVDASPAPRKPGRPRKEKPADPSTPMGEYIAKEAKKARDEKENNKIVEKYYELSGAKLTLIKRTARGSVYKTYIGSTTDKKDGPQVKAFIDRLNKEGRVRVKI